MCIFLQKKYLTVNHYDTCKEKHCIIIINSLLMSPLLGHRPYGLHIRRTGHNPPRGPSAGWWELTTANAAGTNGLTCLPKHGGAWDNIFMITHPMTDERCLTSATARRSALTTGSLSSLKHCNWISNIFKCYPQVQIINRRGILMMI
jgi:hypothetical protein